VVDSRILYFVVFTAICSYKVVIFAHISKAVAYNTTQHNFLENFEVTIILLLEFILRCVVVNFIWSFEDISTVTIVVL
jgi:hypothetical protein